MLIQAEAGLLSITGTPEAPSRVGISVADIAAGMYAYSGILTALLARATTGAGTALEVSLFDALAEWMGAPAYYTGYGGSEPARSGAAHATIAPYELFVSEDEVEIYLAHPERRASGPASASTSSRAARVADDPRFATNATRVQHRADLHATHRRRLRAICRRPRSSIAWNAPTSPCARRNSIDEIHQASAADGPRLAGARSTRRSARCGRCARRCGWRESSR